MKKYDVVGNDMKVLSTHATLAEAGKAAMKHNEEHKHFSKLVGVRHRGQPGEPFIGDVTGLAFAAALKPGTKATRLPRSVRRRKHGPGDEVDEIIRSIKRRQRKRR